MLAGIGAFALSSCSTQIPTVPSLSSQSGATAKAGEIVWHDLVTPNPDQARSFYSQLLGWTIEDDGSPYSVIRTKQGVIGGLVDGRKLGARPESALWLSSLGVKDLDGAVSALRTSGAKIHREPVALPDRGRIALVEDPQKALFQLVELSTEARKPASGTWIWHELVTSDPKAAAAWYAQLQGVKAQAFGSTRYQLTADGRKVATISRNPFSDTRNTWIPVVGVSDLAGKLAMTPSLGGRVVLKSGGGSLAMILDPSGAPLILQQKTGKQS